LDVLQDPTGIFTNDESSFPLCPKTGNILAYRGDKNVYTFHRGLSKTSITAVLAFSASGMCPPMLRYPYTMIPAEITRRFSDDWGVRCSPFGWMTQNSCMKILEYFHSTSWKT
jgi:hypothetical protein